MDNNQIKISDFQYERVTKVLASRKGAYRLKILEVEFYPVHDRAIYIVTEGITRFIYDHLEQAVKHYNRI